MASRDLASPNPHVPARSLGAFSGRLLATAAPATLLNWFVAAIARPGRRPLTLVSAVARLAVSSPIVGIAVILAVGAFLEGSATSVVLVAVVGPVLLTASVLWRLRRRRGSRAIPSDAVTEPRTGHPFNA
jgi:hypothetical protein